MRLLVVNPSSADLPHGTEPMLASLGWTLRQESSLLRAQEAAETDDVAAALLINPTLLPHENHGDVRTLLAELTRRRIATTLVTRERIPGLAALDDGLIDVVDGELTTAELKGRLSVIARYHAMLQRMDLELRNMDEMSARLKEHFQLIDQEMRLAGRLQRDFLPKPRGTIGPIRYASVYRPATWVSGDMFDIIRIDADHTGVFIADAVGHGMAAGLLTMFIKRAVTQMWQTRGADRRLDPAAVLAGLNDALAEQELPNCQFVTACYGVIAHQTLEFRCARAGHPAPLLYRADGSSLEIDPGGGLLGLVRGEQFDVQHLRLAEGDKLLMYTDGLELAFDEHNGKFDCGTYKRVFRSLAELGVDPLTQEVTRRLDAASGSIRPSDDITIVAVEVA